MDTLTGTPVVPGIAHGPALIARTDVSADAIAGFDPSAFPDEDAAMTRYDEVAAAVADGFAAKAGQASGAAAEVLTASAGLARDKGLRSGVLKQLRSGDDLLVAVQAAVESFVTIFTGMGGLMAERVTDLRDIERRMVARLVGEPEPGVPVPDQPCVLVAADLAPADTAGLDPAVVLALVTERGGPTSHTAIIARQLGIPCVVGHDRCTRHRGRQLGAGRRHHRGDRDRARPGRRRSGASPPTASSARRSRPGPGPA